MAIPSRAIAEVMVQVVRTTANQAFAYGLSSTQWAALRYFSQATPSARQVTAFARYNGTTKGTASQTIATLMKKGLLHKGRDIQDSRNVGMELSPSGIAALSADPINLLTDAIGSLEPEHRRALAESLERVYRTVMAGIPDSTA